MSVLRGVLRRAGATTRTSASERAFAVYAALLVLLIVVAPVGRALWLILIRPEAAAGIASVPVGPIVAVIVMVCAAAAIGGVTWGPAARSPWLTSVLADAPLDRVRAFGGPVAALALLTAAGVAAVVGLVTVALSTELPSGAVWMWPAIGLSLGLISVSCAVAGQRFGVRARWAAGGGFILATTIALVPSAPLSVANITWLVVGASGVAAGAVWYAAWCLATMPGTALARAASQTEAAREGLTTLDVTRVSDLARALPQVGRRLHAVRSRLPRFMMFAWRDAVGLVRTPDRLVVGSIGLVVGALLCTSSSWIAVAVGAVILASALSTFCDGVRHAASSASLLYGIARWRLLLLHLSFPTLLLALATAIAIALAPAATATVIATAIIVLVVRVADAAKGVLPVSLLAPIPTAFGDMGALNRLVWALDAPLLAAAAGAAAASLPLSPIWVIIVTVLAGTVAITRWRRDFPN